MPELPEVETIVRGLQHPLLERTIIRVECDWPKSLNIPFTDFEHQIIGRRIVGLTRRAKYLWFKLADEQHLFIHLKMSGNLMVATSSGPRPKHVHVVFGLDNDHELRFRDTRKFGRVYLVHDPGPVIGKLGPEPLADDFTLQKFKALFAQRTGRLKPLLLNQEFLAGLGNIYGDESCFAAKLHPARPVHTLTGRELNRLYEAIRKALQHGIMHRGATFDEVYPGGQFQYHFAVYGRTGQPCLQCQQPIRRMVLGGRSTHFCGKCQK